MTYSSTESVAPKMLGKRAVAERMGRSVRTLDRLIKEKRFPEGVTIRSSPCWPEAEVSEWLKARIQERDERATA